MAQYQGVWSLQSAAQLQSTQRWVTDPLFENTTLLLQADAAVGLTQNNTFIDSSNNAFPIIRNGNTTQGSFTPFSLQPGAWGNYFSGSGNGFLNAVSNAVFAFGTGDFTLEAFINVAAYPAAFPGTAAGNIISAHNWNGSGFDFTFRIQSTGLLYFENSAGNTLSSTTAVPLNTWVHVACVRSSGTLTFYINGSSVGSGAAAGSISSTVAISIGAALSGGTYGNFTGYISNARITRGGALYTTAFTPSMTPLTTTVSSGTVSLLTCQSNRFVDNSVNAFALTAGAGASVQAFSPFAPQFQWTPSVIGGSGYFDGSGDNIQTIGANANLSIGTGDFTFECWAYLVSTAGDPGIMQLAGSPFGTNAPTYTNSIGILAITGSGLWALINNGGFTPSSVSARVNTWTHLAVCRSGTTHRLFVNGVQAASVSDSSNYTTQYFAAGCAYGTNFPSNSYISNIRFVRGTAVYTGAFTPPTRPLSTSGADSASAYPSTTNVNTSFAASATSLFLNFTNAGIYDGTMKNNLETVGNAQVSAAVVKYGSGSMFFDGTGDLLFSPANQNYSFTGDFTIECWVNTSTISLEGGSYRRIFATGPDAVTSLQIVFSDGVTTSGNISVVTNTFVISGNITAATGTWVHVALARLGSAMRLFINGVQSGSTSTTTQAFTGGASNGLFVGSASNGTGRYLGYIDDFRITQGVARYTQNFIPPSVALPRQ